MAVGVVDESRRDLWVFDVESAARLRLTNEADVRAPIWTPDGERIIFSWDKEPPGALFWIPADGSGEAERLTTPDAGTLADVATSVTPDGQAVVFTRALDMDTRELWQAPLDGERTPQPVVQGELAPPQNLWVQIGLLRGGRPHFPAGSGVKHRITQNGRAMPVWSPDGGELFYRPSPPGTAGALFSIELTTEPRFAFTTARSAPAGDFVAEGGSRDYDITPDGQALLVVVHANEDAALPQINVVLNSFEELKDLVPVP